ncbi:hypothetical protein KVR01_009071 [Diaporthe batatas]|uniref:uncharacterized protein n=1 Tax=Diaporthe batatas TaxID=748121 RepID=UPI001D047662|nr:uncharacterized protein KVR01_009071 [Diaporthe batatas]KAG8160807.1 hypothetical protein KVR01_009071 [Diaporthe batatas]
MSSQNASSSSNQEGEQQSPVTAVATTEFPLFLELPTEIQIEVWEWAFWAPRERRLAVLRTSSVPSPALSHQVLGLNNLQVTISWPVSNPQYLAETNHVANLLSAAHRSHVVISSLVQRNLDTPWLRRLGLARYHINPQVDIVFFGGDRNLIGANRSLMAATLVLGEELPCVMCPASDFARLVNADLQRGSVDPVSTALNTLRSVNPVWSALFRHAPDSLPSPMLPRTMYFLLRTDAPRSARCAHGQGECLHFEHLELFDLSASETWNLSFQGLSSLPSQNRFYRNITIISDIRTFFRNVAALPGFTGTIPDILFVQLTGRAER